VKQISFKFVIVIVIIVIFSSCMKLVWLSVWILDLGVIYPKKEMIILSLLKNTHFSL
jgi:hypothetical protein